MSIRDVAPAFSDRYLLARFATGGVVVDLQSGNYFRINRSAATVCEILGTCGDRSAAEIRVARELGLSRTDAAEAIISVTAALATGAMRGTPQGSFHFLPADHGYTLNHGDRSVLEVTGESATIRLPEGIPTPPASTLELYVRALAPKLLFQQGVSVLHASACIVEERLIAFAGLSGAGKTTTADAFVKAGSDVVSEDLLVLFPDNPATVALEGEPFIQAWSRQVTSELLDSRVPIAAEALGHAVLGPTKRLERILFLDRSRRGVDEIISRKLSEPDALIALMTHEFLGSVEPDTWRRFFDNAQALLANVNVKEASVPNGLDRLATAAGRYMSSWTS